MRIVYSTQIKTSNDATLLQQQPTNPVASINLVNLG